jgi:hypothetical protein
MAGELLRGVFGNCRDSPGNQVLTWAGRRAFRWGGGRAVALSGGQGCPRSGWGRCRFFHGANCFRFYARKKWQFGRGSSLPCLTGGHTTGVLFFAGMNRKPGRFEIRNARFEINRTPHCGLQWSGMSNQPCALLLRRGPV